MKCKKFLNISHIFILSIVLLLACQGISTSYALNYEDLKSFAQQNKNYYGGNYFNLLSNNFNNNSYNQIIENLPLNNYMYFILRSNGQNYSYLTLFNATDNTTLTIDGNYNLTNITGKEYKIDYNVNTKIWELISQTNKTSSSGAWNSFTSNGQGNTMIYAPSIPTTINGNYIYVGLGAYGDIMFLTNTIDLSNNENDLCYVADALVGNNLINNISIELYYEENETPVYYNGTIVREQITQGDNQGITRNIYQIYIDRTKIINGKEYTIELLVNDIVVKTSKSILLYEVNTGGNTSGDNDKNSGDNITIDLTQTNQKLDNIEQAIISGDNKIIQAIESGEQKAEERQTFWEKAYNDLFYVSGEEIENKIITLYEKLELPSGEVSGEIAGLDVIKQNPRRFCYIMATIIYTFYIKRQ